MEEINEMRERSLRKLKEAEGFIVITKDKNGFHFIQSMDEISAYYVASKLLKSKQATL